MPAKTKDRGLELYTKEVNGEADNWSAMLSIKEVGEELGLSPTQIRRLCSRGAICRYGPGPDSSFRFKPEDVEALARELADEDAEQSQKKETETFSGAAVALVRQAQDNNTTLLRLATEPGKLALTVLEATVGRQQQRIDTLEAERLKYIEKYEMMLSLQHERELSAKNHERKAIRQDKAFELLMKRAPRLLEQIEKSLGGTPEDRAKITAAVDLLQSLAPAQLEVLTADGAGFLTEEQSKKVKLIVGKTDDEKPEASSTASSDSEEVAAHG